MCVWKEKTSIALGLTCLQNEHHTWTRIWGLLPVHLEVVVWATSGANGIMNRIQEAEAQGGPGQWTSAGYSGQFLHTILLWVYNRRVSLEGLGKGFGQYFIVLINTICIPSCSYGSLQKNSWLAILSILFCSLHDQVVNFQNFTLCFPFNFKFCL